MPKIKMKKNLLKVMDELDIDEGIRPLIGHLWKHCYRTCFSCEGWRNGYKDESKGEHHSVSAYVVFKEGSGDGWFEENASKYGLEPHKNDLAEIKGYKRMALWRFAKLPKLRVGDTLGVFYSLKEGRFVKCYSYYQRRLTSNPLTPRKYCKKTIEETYEKIERLVGIPITAGVIGASIGGPILSLYGGYQLGELLSKNINSIPIGFLVLCTTTLGATLIGTLLSFVGSEALGDKLKEIAPPIVYKILKRRKKNKKN